MIGLEFESDILNSPRALVPLTPGLFIGHMHVG